MQRWLETMHGFSGHVTYQVRQACGVRGELVLAPSSILAVDLRDHQSLQEKAVDSEAEEPTPPRRHCRWIPTVPREWLLA
jgi:hypothetical protein